MSERESVRTGASLICAGGHSGDQPRSVEYRMRSMARHGQSRGIENPSRFIFPPVRSIRLPQPSARSENPLRFTPPVDPTSMYFARTICQPETALSPVIPPIQTLFCPERYSARCPDKYEGPASRRAKTLTTKSGCGNDLRVSLNAPQRCRKSPD